MPITNAKITKLHGKPRDNTTEFPDRDGLVLSVGKTGKCTWVFRYRFNKLQRRMKIGIYPALDLDEARKELIPYLKALQEGTDPKHYLADKDSITIDYCAQKWSEGRFDDLKPKTRTLYESTSNKYFTLDRFPHDVRSARFEYWLSFFDRIAKDTSKTNSGAVYKIARTMLKWCKSRNIIDKSILFDIDLKAIGQQSKVGQRNLQLNELGLVWGLCGRNSATLAIKSCVKLLIIFGARNAEIREANRNEFDLLENVWTLPAQRSKTGKAVRRPIPELAKRIILDLDETYGAEGYLIKGSHRGTCMTAHALNRFVVRLWGRMHKAFNADKFTPHDFRRTISTRLSEREILPHVTEKMLGHELGGIMAVYNKHDWIDEQRIAYELWCDMILEANKTALSRLNAV